jgi:hypothetical protein
LQGDVEAVVAGKSDPNLRRAGDPNAHDAEIAALRREMGMGAVRSPLPVNLDGITHDHPVSHPDAAAQGPSLDELIAHQRPPVPTHFVDGALDEHAHHVKRADPED